MEKTSSDKGSQMRASNHSKINTWNEDKALEALQTSSFISVSFAAASAWIIYSVSQKAANL